MVHKARASLGAALRAWCGQEDLAAEALDEAFVRALERWSRVGSLASPSGWVWQTATNVVRRRERRRRLEDQLLRRRAASPSDDHAAPPPDVDLQHAVLELTERQRSAIVLYYLADLPVRQVAEVSGSRRAPWRRRSTKPVSASTAPSTTARRPPASANQTEPHHERSRHPPPEPEAAHRGRTVGERAARTRGGVGGDVVDSKPEPSSRPPSVLA